jgi:hypothetical protein
MQTHANRWQHSPLVSGETLDALSGRWTGLGAGVGEDVDKVGG